MSWGTSFQVNTASMPGTFIAAEMSISSISALAWGERSSFTTRYPFGTTSSR